MPASLIHSSALSQNGRASDMWRSCFNVWVLFQDTLIAMTWCTFTSIIFLSMSLHVINNSQWRKNWQIVYPLTLSDPTRISSHKSIASPAHLAFIQLLSNHHWYSPATSDPIRQNSSWASHLSHLLHCSPAEIWALVLPWDFAIQQAVTLGCLSLLNICRPQNTLTVGAGWWRSLDNSKLGSKHIFIGCGKPLAPAIDNTSSTWNISILSQDTCHTLYVTANSTYSKTETFENTDIFSTVLQKINHSMHHAVSGQPHFIRPFNQWVMLRYVTQNPRIECPHHEKWKTMEDMQNIVKSHDISKFQTLS